MEIMLYTLITLVILLILSILITIKILDVQFEKQIQKQREQEKIAQSRLTESLKSLCKQLSISLSYHDILGDAAGKILYHSLGGRLILDNAEIQILNKFQNEPWVLAHELGHYMAIKQREDNTEQGADKEAKILCESFLTEKEKELLSIHLRVYFKS